MTAIATAPAPIVGAGAFPFGDNRPDAGYGRISKDRNDGGGAGLGVRNQRGAVNGYLARMDRGPVADADWYDDNDKSGYDPNTVRDDFNALLDAIRARQYRSVTAFHIDRYGRQQLVLTLLWLACEESGTELHTVAMGQAKSELAWTIHAALAVEESKTKSRRQTLKHEQLARDGQFHGGRRRFGYEPGMSAIRESEAIVIREAVRLVLAGSTLASVARWINETGTLGPEAWKGWHPPMAHPVPKWTGPNVSVLLRRPHLAGLRVHHGEVVGKAEWDGIITETDRERLLHVLGDPKRKTNRTGNARRYLLTGLAVCATCGATLRGRPGPTTDGGRAYQCSSGKHCYRATDLVDNEVVTRVVGRLRFMDESGQLVLDDGAGDELARLTRTKADLEARLAEYAAAAHTMSPTAYAAATKGIEDELAKMDDAMTAQAVERTRPKAILDGMTGTMAEAAWNLADLGRQRAIVQLLTERVELRGASETGRRTFHPEDVVVCWR